MGFRVFVHDAAVRLGLRGYTRNLPDRSVEVVVAGDESALQQLLVHLNRGPRAARVDFVEHQWLEHEPDGLGGRFEVRG